MPNVLLKKTVEPFVDLKLRRMEPDHMFRIKTTGLAQGTYVARIKAGSESLRYRFIIGK